MATANQYLQLEIEGASYLLPSGASIAIEQRDTLSVNDARSGPVTAWRTVRSGRWPAYALDAGLRLSPRSGWTRGVFLDSSPQPVGLLIDEVQLLSHDEIRVEPFTPLGPYAMRLGHLFSGAWVDGSRVVLAFDPRILAVYLQELGGRQ